MSVGGSRLYRFLGYRTRVSSTSDIYQRLWLMYSVMVNNAKQIQHGVFLMNV